LNSSHRRLTNSTVPSARAVKIMPGIVSAAVLHATKPSSLIMTDNPRDLPCVGGSLEDTSDRANMFQFGGGTILSVSF
ncbi:MAG: hypothetical protein ACHQY2_06505, partial [Candidatus Eremiobacterales bacterium]